MTSVAPYQPQSITPEPINVRFRWKRLIALVQSDHLYASSSSTMLDRLRARSVPIVKRDDSVPVGDSVWICDQDSAKLELWQPKSKPTHAGS